MWTLLTSAVLDFRFLFSKSSAQVQLIDMRNWSSHFVEILAFLFFFLNYKFTSYSYLLSFREGQLKQSHAQFVMDIFEHGFSWQLFSYSYKRLQAEIR